jgi:hypothetical protein
VKLSLHHKVTQCSRRARHEPRKGYRPTGDFIIEHADYQPAGIPSLCIEVCPTFYRDWTILELVMPVHDMSRSVTALIGALVDLPQQLVRILRGERQIGIDAGVAAPETRYCGAFSSLVVQHDHAARIARTSNGRGREPAGVPAEQCRLKEAWSGEHARWSKRDLSTKRYIYFCPRLKTAPTKWRRHPKTPTMHTERQRKPGRAGAFDTFCTVPVIASSAPMRRANWISQPPQGLQVACLRLACDWRVIDEREPARGE